MKRAILVLLLMSQLIFWGSISAQEKDSILVRQIPALKDSLFKQQQELYQLKSRLDSVNQKLERLYKSLKIQSLKNANQQKDLANLSQIFRVQKVKLDSIENIITITQNNVKNISSDLTDKIKKTEDKTKQEIYKLDNSLSKSQLHWMIGILSLLVLGLLMYILLRKKIISDKTDIEKKLQSTRKSLEEETIKIDNKLIELLESQLKLMKAERETQPKTETEPDHSLALKIADEIIRIQKNISRMDENIKGVNSLLKGIERIRANFSANGYDIPDLLGKEYDDRMNVDVINFIIDENIQKGKAIITKIIKPQVNYRGVLIQRAQVEVSHN